MHNTFALSYRLYDYVYFTIGWIESFVTNGLQRRIELIDCSYDNRGVRMASADEQQMTDSKHKSFHGASVMNFV
jgi:hypothetical protein